MARSSFFPLVILFGLFSAQATQAVDLPLQQPSWAELPAPKRSILAPLASDWDSFGSVGRQKWLRIAERYPTLSQAEQTRLQGRMKIWADLSPEERDRARRNFKLFRHLTPEQLRQKWEEYKNLPPEEKQRLQALAKQKAQPKLHPGKKLPASAHIKPVTKSINSGLVRGVPPVPSNAIVPPISPQPLAAPLLPTGKPTATVSLPPPPAPVAPPLPVPATATP